MKAHNPRSPGRKGRFCWHKKTDPGTVTWRLFLRMETNGAVLVEIHVCNVDTSRNAIARRLWQMRRTLRYTVDELDLKNLGVEA